MAKTPVIAIVDDDEGVRASLASLVRSLGYEAHAYESGVAFLREPAGEDPA
jgi:FixJ family two-component response regulator